MTTLPATPFKSDLANFNDSIDSVNEGVHYFLWHRHRTLVIFVWFLTAVVGVPLGYFAWYTLTHGVDPRISILIGLLVFLIPGIFYARVTARMERVFYEQLSEALGLSYTPSAPLTSAVGHLFSMGEPMGITNVLSGSYRGIPLRLYVYRFTTGSGKSRETHTFTVCELTFQATMPAILVHSKNFLGEGSFLNWTPRGAKPLTVEGPFNQKFDVYVEVGKEIEGLQLLEPDTMAKLLDSYSGFGFECCENRLNVFTPYTPNTKEAYGKFLTLADNLFDILIPEIGRVGRVAPGETTGPTT